jgi:hypothetical protein
VKLTTAGTLTLYAFMLCVSYCMCLAAITGRDCVMLSVLAPVLPEPVSELMRALAIA